MALTDKLTAIANAIRAKTGGSSTLTLPQMAQAIDALPTGGTLIPKTITENGVYNATDDDADGYDIVTVSVPEKNTLDEYFADTLEVADISSVTAIPNSFFQNKTNLISVIMPNVVSIGSSSFSNCGNLVLTKLPSSVARIGPYSFRNCRKILYLDFSYFTSIPTVELTSFYGINLLFYFRDQQQLDEFAAATNWSTYADRFQIKPSGVI